MPANAHPRLRICRAGFRRLPLCEVAGETVWGGQMVIWPPHTVWPNLLDFLHLYLGARRVSSKTGRKSFKFAPSDLPGIGISVIIPDRAHITIPIWLGTRFRYGRAELDDHGW